MVGNKCVFFFRWHLSRKIEEWFLLFTDLHSLRDRGFYPGEIILFLLISPSSSKGVVPNFEIPSRMLSKRRIANLQGAAWHFHSINFKDADIG